MRFWAVILGAFLSIILMSPAGAKPVNPSASLSVNPSSSLVYGGHADIGVSLSGSGSDTASLYTYCTQNGTTWLENSQEILGSGIKGYVRVATVGLPTAGSYEYDWAGGSAACYSELYLYIWRGGQIAGTSVAATVGFNVAA